MCCIDWAGSMYARELQTVVFCKTAWRKCGWACVTEIARHPDYSGDDCLYKIAPLAQANCKSPSNLTVVRKCERMLALRSKKFLQRLLKDICFSYNFSPTVCESLDQSRGCKTLIELNPLGLFRK